MKDANASIEDVLDKVVECARRGLQVELMLRDGHKIKKFRVHEVIAPKSGVSAPSEARARGIVWSEHGTRRDEYIQVRDIQSVRAEQVTPYFASEEFFERHPLPPNWLRLARCPSGPKA